MAWSKTKQQLESFLCESLKKRVEYRATAYRYSPDKSGKCYISVDKKEVFDMSEQKAFVRWYKSEQEIKNDTSIFLPIDENDMKTVREEGGNKIPEERIQVIARNKKIADYAKKMMNAQTLLSKSDFYTVANTFLSSNVNQCLASEDILLNILALVDRRVGKKRLRDMRETILLKHPIVQYFYKLRCEEEGIL
ncbi:SF0329 family protein [Clostridium sp. Marseille-P299]|uniref:SF0329 family protein n=1 Tax=Clostridium sp. Marseille-P299 TaxID=1805477 RepID=UPI000829E3F6|nr:hypothetical protein [Clostridium sp. Marseille-P299]